MREFLLFLCLLFLFGCSSDQKGQNPQEQDPPEAIIVEPGVSYALANSRAKKITNIVYDLEFYIPAVVDKPIEAKEVLRFHLEDISSSLQLDFRESRDKIKSVIINGVHQPIDFQNEHLMLAQSALVEGENQIEIEFIAGETSLNRNSNYLYTLFVPDRARTAYPVLDQPNLKARFNLSLNIPADWLALANGQLEGVIQNGDRSIHNFATSDLLSTYLFSFVAGEFQKETRIVDGREINFLYRESDAKKIVRNLDAIFNLHAQSLTWLEEYTDIAYPFQKFDFVAIPGFQYGGMEHVGAIQYRASSLFLDEAPSETQLLGRANLIAHEVAHMWFGNLVTMDWFNDVWTKEVFANFMAAKIVNPSFPTINHDLSFLLRHYPAAYSVDRTLGANPIRQDLLNLNEAGSLYGAIIYSKAPIMMRQLEMLIGETVFRDGIREYLTNYAHSNATWPDLIEILDKRSSHDLKGWSEVWVNTAGRPTICLSDDQNYEGKSGVMLRQVDTFGKARFWPQEFSVSTRTELSSFLDIEFTQAEYVFGGELGQQNLSSLLVNSNGRGYGLFPIQLEPWLSEWERLDETQKGSLLINLYELLLTGNPQHTATSYFSALVKIAHTETNEQLLNTIFGQLRFVFWSLLPESERLISAKQLETLLWRNANNKNYPASTRKIFFNAYRDITLSEEGLKRLYEVWNDQQSIDNIVFSEREKIVLSAVLAIKIPKRAESIIERQFEKIKNADDKRRYAFIAPALSASEQTRNSFFTSLRDEKNREVESWVLTGLSYLHHPLRIQHSEQYILPSLEILEEIQATGDIFFPGRWMTQTLQNHRSQQSVDIVERFLEERPDYNKQLRLKILQASDPLFTAIRTQPENYSALKWYDVCSSVEAP